jgi:hypothetical protein
MMKHPRHDLPVVVIHVGVPRASLIDDRLLYETICQATPAGNREGRARMPALPAARLTSAAGR